MDRYLGILVTFYYTAKMLKLLPLTNKISKKKMPKTTGYYLLEALILALINPKQDDRFFIELQAQ